MLENKLILKKTKNIIVLLMTVVILIGIYEFIDKSKAEKIIEINAIAQDSSGILLDEEFLLQAKQLEDGIYEIELPESVNSKIISKVVGIELGESTNTENDELLNENKIYLTKEQIEKSKLSINVKYDTKNIDEINLIEKINPIGEVNENITVDTETNINILYNKILKYEDKENNKLVELRGYLPQEAKIQVEEVQQNQLAEIFSEKKVKVAYDIKIFLDILTTVPTDEANQDAEPDQIIEKIEINPENFGEKCQVSIKDVNILENSQVYHVKEDNTYEKVTIKDNTTEGNISFEAQSFSIYVVTDGEVEPNPGEDTGAVYGTTISTYTLTYADGTSKSVSYASSDNLTVTLPAGGSVTINFSTYSCEGRGSGTCFNEGYRGITSYTCYSASSRTWLEHRNGGSTHSSAPGTTVTVLEPPKVTVSTTSCDWRNSALSTTITVTGAGSGSSYQYYLSNSSTALSGGSWTTYTSGTAINLNPGTSGTYYMFVKRVTNNGEPSSSNGTDITVSGTVYHRFGPYKFDYTNPVPGEWLKAGPNLESNFYTNQSSVTIYAKAGTDAHSGIGGVEIHGWYGGSWAKYNNSQTATYDSTNDRYYCTFQFKDLVNTTTGSTNQGEGIYTFDYYVYDKVGNRKYGRRMGYCTI